MGETKASTRDRLRIAAVVSTFPASSEPHSGMPIFNQMKALARIADLTVYVVKSQYPQLRLLHPTSFVLRQFDPSYTVGGVSVRYVPFPVFPWVSRGLNGRVCAGRLRPLLRDHRPDVILSYFVYPEGNAAVRVGRQLGIPAVVGAVGSDLLRIPDAVTRMMVKQTLRGASHVVTKSGELADRAVRLGASPDHVTPILNGCDADVFRLAPREPARRALSIRPETRLALFTGRLAPVKELPDLFAAVQMVNQAGHPLDLAVIGEGPLDAELRAMCRERGLDGIVHFVGQRGPTEVAQWMAACDVFCLSSSSEGCPNVVLEALCCGRPVVATAVGALPDLIDSRCGVLVPARNPRAFADALLQALAATWDEAMISRVYRRDWSTMAQETLDVCCRVARRTESPAGARQLSEAL